MADAPTTSTLIAANERFYRVFESLDYPAMEALWEKSDRVFCVHPGWPPLHGDKPVLDSWRRIIENTAAMQFTLTDVRARVEGHLGVVTLYEHLFTSAGDERHSSTVVTTNLFGFDEPTGRWLLYHHHAAHAPAPPAGPIN